CSGKRGRMRPLPPAAAPAEKIARGWSESARPAALRRTKRCKTRTAPAGSWSAARRENSTARPSPAAKGRPAIIPAPALCWTISSPPSHQNPRIQRILPAWAGGMTSWIQTLVGPRVKKKAGLRPAPLQMPVPPLNAWRLRSAGMTAGSAPVRLHRVVSLQELIEPRVLRPVAAVHRQIGILLQIRLNIRVAHQELVKVAQCHVAAAGIGCLGWSCGSSGSGSAFGAELLHAACRLAAGPLRLGGFHLIVIGGARLQIAQVHSMG